MACVRWSIRLLPRLVITNHTKSVSIVQNQKLCQNVIPQFRTLVTSANFFAKKKDQSYNEQRYLKQAKDTALASYEYFTDIRDKEKNKETFKNAIDLFNRRDIRKRGSVEFIRAALKHMKTYGVHKDLEVYKAMIDILPKGKYVPENLIQANFKHYPKQQDCIVEVLLQMEQNGVIPDLETGELLLAQFGRLSGPYRRYARMMYWMPKFKNASPWPVPFEVPNDPLELAKLAIERITSVDTLTEITVYDTADVPESVDKTWIVSGISPDQKEIIQHLPKTKSLFIEGGFRVWLRESQVTYFILRGEPIPRPPPPAGDIDDIKNLRLWMIGDKGSKEEQADSLVKLPNVHEQEDGTIIACCATGTSSKDSLLSWIRLLQKENPDLENIPILFTLHSPLGPVVPFEEKETSIS